jgi:ATP/maltotriose-dependent transcriptional regulator MalT
VSLGLRRATAENDQRVGEVQLALTHLDRVLRDIKHLKQEDRAMNGQNHAYLLAAHARLLVEVGRPDDALLEFEQSCGLLTRDRDRAIRLGDIARLLAARGEVDQALNLQQESLAILEALGDKHEQAITLCNIARLLVAKGEVDTAMKLHREELVVYEASGDSHGIANTLWSIARIKLGRQHSQQAFEHLAASYAICLKIGNLVAICHVGLDFGRLLCDLGRREKSLSVLERCRDGFIALGRPGDARSVQSIINEIQK